MQVILNFPPPCEIKEGRSHNFWSTPQSIVGVEITVRAPDSPDQVQGFGHAVADGVHGGAAGGALLGVVLAEDRVVLDSGDRDPVEGSSDVGIPGLGHMPAGA